MLRYFAAGRKKKMSKLVKKRDVDGFFENMVKIIEQARVQDGQTFDLTMCVTYFEIGHMIFEKEQNSKAWVVYGSELVEVLAEFLRVRFKRDFSVTTLKSDRKFYQVYAAEIN